MTSPALSTQISTKLCPPVLRPDLVPRPWLVSRLERLLSRRLVLLSAPAGSGKTTLLAQWAHASEWPVAWVSLDEDDDDPARFWTCVLAALDQVDPTVSQRLLPVLHGRQPEVGGTFVAMLINQCARVADPFALVLDDLQAIGSEAILSGLATMVDYMPAPMHLLLGSRYDPALPLARWRAQGRLGELRGSDLQFTLEESQALLRKIVGGPLSQQELAELHRWTEGWAAGLHLAGLTIEQQRAQRAGLSLPDLRQDGRHLADYVASEVVERQPERLRRFLLQTSILEELNGPLCDAVTGVAGGAATLDELYRRNLFLTALDRRGSYRYHHLFGELLRRQARREMEQALPGLHARAANWYADQGQPDRAIGHYIAAGRTEQAGALIRRVARQRLMQGESATVLRWLRALPEDAVAAEPRFCLLGAWAATNLGQAEAALPYLALLEAAPIEGEDAALLASEAAAVRARVAILQGRAGEHAHYARRALELLPAEARVLRSEALLDLAFAHNDGQDAQQAREAFRACIVACREAGNLRAGMLASYYLADLCLYEGQAPEAARLYQEALAWCRESDPLSPLACWPHAGLGALLYEWGDLEAAEEHLRAAIRLAEVCAEPKPMLYARIPLAHLLQTTGQPHGARALLEQAGAIAQQTCIVPMSRLVNAAWIRLLMRQGRGDEAGAWLRQNGVDLAREDLAPEEVMMLACYQLGDGAGGHSAPRETLERLADRLLRLQQMAALGGGWQRARVSVLLATAYAALGRDAAALEEILRALEIGEAMGLCRSWADWPAPGLAALLQRLPAERRQSAYVRRVTEALARERAAAAAAAPREAPGALMEELRPREIEVLQHVARGLSDREIARELILGVTTVKWHLRNIYGKLGVNRRTQAVAQARALGLLPPVM